MKKVVSIFLAVMLLLGVVAYQPPVAAMPAIRIVIDGKPMAPEVAPVKRDGRVLVPFRALFEAFDAEVGWHEATRTVTGRRGDTVISLNIGRNVAVVDGRNVNLDVAPIVIGGRTLVPLRFVSENLGAEVSWNEATRTVNIVSAVAERPAEVVAIRRVRLNDAQSLKLAAYANQDAFITPAELKMLMDRREENLVVIGVLNPASALIPLHAVRAPIAGSFAVWRPDYSGTGSPLAVAPTVGGMAGTREVMENLLSRAGATPDSMIVVYAEGAFHDAARFMWQIRQLGHRDVRFLDGGLNAWQAANFPTGSFARLTEQPVRTTYRAPNFNPRLNNITLQEVVNARRNPHEWVIIDARSADEFNGRPSPFSRGAFGLGRIDGSVHIDWVAANAADRTLRTRAEIAAVYGETIRGRRVIVLCQSGVRSSHTTMVLRDVLGHTEVFNFDGSWLEWSFAASEANATVVPAGLRQQVLGLTAQWTDNRGELR
jgi:thiosulfate/3-mercaptopyruvate sulfurtransferase